MSYTSMTGIVPRGGAALIALAALIAPGASALADGAPESKGVCLRAEEIDHTHVLNDRQVLFYMKDRKIWLNTLQGRCVTLPVQEGFVMGSGFSEFCANAQAIHVVNTRETCSLGEFTPYEKPVSHL